MSELKIKLPTTAVFSTHANDELLSVLSNYSSSIISECNRLAAAEALDGRPSEITAATVQKANRVFQISNGLDTSKKPPTWLRVVSSALPIVTGAFPNLVDMTQSSNILLMVVLIVMSTASVVALIMKDHVK